MDQKTSDVYRKMGFTHVVTIPSSDPRQPDGYKAVKAGDRAGIFVDENGQEYTKADPLPGTPVVAAKARSNVRAGKSAMER